MTDEASYEPTRIRRLYVRGYRSIRELDLVDLPSIVVFHGENGAGKSNIMRAMALPLRWLGSELELASTREASARIDYATADAQLGIRRDDFCKFAPDEMQFGLSIELGSRAWGAGSVSTPATRLDIDVTVQDVGDGIRWWVSRADLGNGLSLVGDAAKLAAAIRQELTQFAAQLGQAQSNAFNSREQLKLSSLNSTQRTQIQLALAQQENYANQLRSQIENANRRLNGESVLLDRIRSKLLRRDLLRVSDAYRSIGREPIGNANEFDVDMDTVAGSDQIQRRLYLLATSSDLRERAIPRTLATRMTEAMAPNDGAPMDIDIAAVRNYEFREYETQIKRGNLEGIPIANLGTGEQQLMILLLDVLIASTPIVQIEEPEAHLHKKFMLRLAQMLQRLVEAHDVDQLFIATHHHAFAIASEYYDVTYDEKNGTRATLTNRAKAVEHFYEPGPLWDALRSLVASGLQENAVLFRDERGTPIRAREVLASINEEGPLAKKFAEEMTKTILLSMREEAEFGDA